MTLNTCQAGHGFHVSKQVDSEFGPIRIWDWERYMDFPGYCPGQDEVSKSIDVNHAWEKPDTDHFRQILKQERGHVLDFGSHIGWFTVQALKLGCDVDAFDADPENMRLLWLNLPISHPSLGTLTPHLGWVADYESPATFDYVRLMKVDIEGHEHEALDLTRHLWEDRKIDYGLWELSPIFEKREGIMAESYAALVTEIESYGYRWYILKGEERWYFTVDEMTFPQENAWAERRP